LQRAIAWRRSACLAAFPGDATVSPKSPEDYRETLLELRLRLTREVDYMSQAVPEIAQSGGELSHLPSHNADRDSEGVDKEVSLLHNEEALLEQVDEALARLTAGTFGRCVECGQPISEERLEAIPYAACCIDCARKLERRQNA
jgi:DnaK suppressor protein